MGGFNTGTLPLDLAETIRRARLAQQLGMVPRDTLANAPSPVGNSEGPMPSVSPVGPSVLEPRGTVAPVQETSQNPREQALSSYRQALQEPIPSEKDYHPSFGRRLGGILLGGLSQDPKVGRSVAYGPFDQKMTDYQKRLAQKKELFETEFGAAGTEAKIGAETERAGAEKARAEREASQKKAVEWKELTPEGREFQLELAGVKHPGRAPGAGKIFKVHLKNGEDILAHVDREGQLVDTEGTILGPESYSGKEVYNIGVEKPDKPVEHKEYQDFHDGYLLKHPKATGAEIAAAYKALPTGEKPPQVLMIDPGTHKAIAVRPGTEVPEGARTPSGESTENIGTAPTRRMRETAPRVIDLVKRTRELTNQQLQTLGPGKSRWADFWSGTVGEPNPEFRKLKTNVILLRSLLMNMHTGSQGRVAMMKEFREIIDSAKDSPENLLAALQEIQTYAEDIEAGGKPKEGGSETPQTTDPKDPLGILKKK